MHILSFHICWKQFKTVSALFPTIILWYLWNIFIYFLQSVQPFRWLEDVDDWSPVVMKNQINNCIVILRRHLHCEILNRILRIWNIGFSREKKYLSFFIITVNLLRKPGCHKRHFKGIWERMKSFKRLRVHSSHYSKGSIIWGTRAAASDSPKLKNEYFTSQSFYPPQLYYTLILNKYRTSILL